MSEYELFLKQSKCAIIEEDYTDRDFSDAYSKVYARGHRDSLRRCKRIHFFDRAIRPTDFLHPENEAELENDYRGYCVLLPTIPQTIGRTILKSQNSASHFVLVTDKYPVNLLGFTLGVRGFPFIVQDQRVSACATAALWMCNTSLSQKYNLAYHSTTEITEIATQRNLGTGRAIPSTGLTIEQMVDAVNYMGYAPVLYRDFDPDTAKDIIYKQIESQLPAILAIEYNSQGHALIAVGHTYQMGFNVSVRPNPDWVKSWQPHLSSSWVPAFLVNDDRRGPLRELKFAEPDKEFSCPVVIDTSSKGNKDELKANLNYILLLLPKQVFITGTQAELKAYNIIYEAWRTWFSTPPPKENHYVLRTFLMTSNEFKESLSNRSVPPAPFLLHHYRGKRLSRYVWVTEIGELSQRNGKSAEEILIKGEVLIDSASSLHDRLDFLCVHLPGKLAYAFPEDQHPIAVLDDPVDIPDDAPYSPIIRH